MPVDARLGGQIARRQTRSRSFEQDVLFTFENLAHRRPLEYAVLPCGIVGEFLYGKLDPRAPTVEDKRIGIAGGELIALHPLLSGDELINLLERRPKIFLPHVLDSGEGVLVLAKAL